MHQQPITTPGARTSPTQQSIDTNTVTASNQQNRSSSDTDTTRNGAQHLTAKAETEKPHEIPDEKFKDVVSNQAAAMSPSSAPPDGGYGWVIVLGCFLINFHSWGINSTYGVFLAYYLANNTFDGASYLDFAFVGGLSIGVALLVAPLATATIGRFGTKVTLSVGIAFETVALITAGSATKIWQLFLSQGVAFGVGMGFLFVASVGLAPQWFQKRRSLANGICAAGSGIGALTFNLAAQAIIDRWGFPWALRILGICAFCSNTFATIIVKDRNEQVGARTVALDLKLFKKWEFVLLQLWGFFSMLGYVVILFSLPNYARTIGLTARQGSIISALLNLGQGVGRPPVGYFSDSLGRINMAALMTLLSAIFAFAIWIPSNSYGVLILYAILGGAVIGTYWATIGPVAAEIIGLQDLPSALSLSWLVLVLPTTFSEPIALEIVQRTPSAYLGAQIYAGLMYLVAALCLMPVRAWKINQLEEAERQEGLAPNNKSNNNSNDNDDAEIKGDDIEKGIIGGSSIDKDSVSASTALTEANKQGVVNDDDDEKANLETQTANPSTHKTSGIRPDTRTIPLAQSKQQQQQKQRSNPRRKEKNKKETGVVAALFKFRRV